MLTETSQKTSPYVWLAMAVELARLAAKLPVEEADKTVAAVSGTAKPITPVGSRGQSHVEIDPRDPDKADGLTTAEWMRRREAQVSRTSGKA